MPNPDLLAVLCDQFQRQLELGQNPRITTCLDKIEAGQHVALLSLLLPIEIEHRLKSGENVQSGDYAQHGPVAIELAEQLIASRASREMSPPPTVISPVGQVVEATVIGDVDPSPVATETAVNRQVGPYRLVQPIGEGGMGSVYLAEQTEPVRRQVALKLIRPGMASPEVLNRFQAERQALAVMDHENIAKVLDAGSTQEGQLYFVMEYVPGVPITQYADERKLPLNERLELFVQVCRALQHAHLKGVIHRDIKPSNVLVREADGRPIAKVIDFGLAKTLGTERLDQTIPGQIMGTYQYMSPEQAGANVLDIDTRTDVYSLGVLLYELLTGSTPLEKSRLRELAFLGILKAIREEEPQRPSSRLSTLGSAASSVSESRGTNPRHLSRLLSRDLDWITLRALEKDRNRRYDGPAQLAADIQRFLRGDPVEATPPSLSYRLRKAVWRNRLAFSMAGTVLVLLVMGLVGTTQQMWRAMTAEETAESRRLKAEAETARATRAESFAKEQQRQAEISQQLEQAARTETEKTLARSDYFLGVARIEQHRPADAAMYLDRIPAEYREFEWWLARQQVDDSQRTIYSGASAIGFSSDDRTLNLWTRYPGIRQFRLSGDGAVKETTTSYSAVVGQFMRGGKKLLAAARPEQAASSAAPTTVAIFDVETGQEVRRFPPVESSIHTVESNDPATLVGALCLNGPLYIWEADSGRLRLRVPPGKTRFTDFAISPDGTLVCTTNTEGKSVSLWNGMTGEFLRELASEGQHTVQNVCFSPDGEHLAASSLSYSPPAIQVWNVRENFKQKLFTEHTDYIYHLAFSPDGLYLGSCSSDRTIKVRNVVTGELVGDFAGHNSTILEIAFSSSGTQLASRELSGNVKIWDFSATGSSTVIDALGNVTSIAFHPNQPVIALGNSGGFVDLWDLQSRRPLMHQHVHMQPVPCVAFTTDGAEFVSAGWDSMAAVFDTASGEKQNEFAFCDGKASNVILDSGAKKLAATRQDDASIEIWDVAKREHQGVITTQEHMLRPVQLALDAEGQRLAAIDGLNRVCLFDVETGELKQTLNKRSSSQTLHSSRILSFGQQRHQLLASTDSLGLTVWNIDSGEAESQIVLDADQGFLPAAVLHPSGKRVITAARREARIWDLANGEVLRTLPGLGGFLPAVACSADGTLLAASMPPIDCLILRAKVERNSSSLSGHLSRVSSVTLTPDGRWVASGAVNGSVIVWDRQTGKPVRTINELKFPIGGVYLSPGGTRIACREYGMEFTGTTQAISSHEQVTLWDIRSGKQLAELLDHQTFLAALAFSPDEQLVAAADGSRKVYVWNATDGQLLQHWTEVSAVPSSLAFSMDGQWLRGDSANGVTTYWNVKSPEPGQPVAPEVVFAPPISDTSANGHWQVSHLGNSVVVTDLYGAEDPVTARLQQVYWHMRQLERTSGRSRYSSILHACCLLQLLLQAPETMSPEIERYFNTKSARSFLTEAIVNAVKAEKSEKGENAVIPSVLEDVRSQLSTGADLNAARYVLSKGGRIRFRTSGEVIKNLKDLPLGTASVAMIDFRGTRLFTEDGLAACANLPDLEHLDFVATPLTDAGLQHFSQSKKLVILDLVDAPIGDAGLQAFDGISTIQHLWLGGTRTTDLGTACFRNCQSLLQLDLRATQVTDAGLQPFKNCPNLISLFLSRTTITDEGLMAFDKLTKLTRLDLSMTQVSDAGLSNFANCSGLTELHLTKTRVSDASLDQILTYSHLKLLSLGGAQMSESALATIREKLPQCNVDVRSE